MSSDHDLWYKDAIFYELHVKAFQDGNSDGTGDFRGLVSRLDYLQELGITCIWLLPFYPSPLRDDGYDIAEYLDVNPRYGDPEDVRVFLEEAHRRGIRVIADLVLNHTSDQHPWFQRARRAPKGSPERDWYVWSDTDTGYPDARVIFTDTESSNWSWDPVAGQYYWHRFFAHQPDLNWDNPEVREMMFQVMEYWLDLGLDGFRADAVPYLIEREGTICENLPETHAILREFRARLESRFPGRVLLAEANQWPADVCAYFGDSDEFHMAFHFPLMPRIFMAVRQGIRTPIVEVIENTPGIPPDCQWCMFLRNHDELTLEMVTDEERDYMYREYATDPRMRLNLGIRRRLAPLMEGDRRKIELLNALLFTMPGSPILYYGDEIGMGDNIWLGDRDGVRTPMQWSPDRNAGFSRAEPERLFLPVISDSVYGYQAVNVDAQQRSPFSLLNWMKRLIRVRRRHLALGRGSIRFLKPGNPHILAYLREYGDDVVLVVGNLAATAQLVELDLAEFEGRVPVEMLGSTPFLEIAAEPYVLTLAPYDFFWFAIRPNRMAADVNNCRMGEEERNRLLREWAEADREVFANPDTMTRLVSELSHEWLNRQRWFRSKSREVARIECFDSGTIFPPDEAGGGIPLLLVIPRVSYLEGEPEYYFLPLVPWLPEAGEVEETAVFSIATPGCDLSLYEGVQDPGAALALLRIINGEAEVVTGAGVFRGTRFPGYESFSGEIGQVVPAAGGEQSNSSVRFGDLGVMKIFRKLEPGVHPELEVSRFLEDHTGFRAFPRLLGSIEYTGSDSSSAAVAGLFDYIP
ncbi:MAG: maltose alpha-D-glucosyltransferase, partial [Gemmatimonadota bacterium]|nr:maltose alpha-D-glucosyltransferase [Gemmatimonadota bacterium]